MSHQYTGSTAAFPANFTIPDDADAENAASVNVALQALGDRTAYLNAFVADRVDTLTAASGTWTCPPNVTKITIEAIGAGGNGAGGGGANTAAYSPLVSSVGGGGGGASRKNRVDRLVTPGAVISYAVGQPSIFGGHGGSGGTVAGVGGIGNDGGDTSFNGEILSRGGGGGNAYPTTLPAAAANQFPWVPGGCSPRGGDGPQALGDVSLIQVEREPTNGEGGRGGCSQSVVSSNVVGQPASRGGSSSHGVGGAAGASGASTGTPAGGGSTAFRTGGGGGGGGGASEYGDGAVGGAGSDASPTTAATGNNGANASAPGAGGGGGGGGGCGFTAGGGGGNGGSGAAGQIIITYHGSQAVFT